VENEIARYSRCWWAAVGAGTAHEAQLGHMAIAQYLRDLIDESKRRSSAVGSG
jgi:hypothetical protein